MTPREVEILQLISLGVPFKAIPMRLSISLGSARNYAQSARCKLGAQSNAQAVRIGIEKGILEVNIEEK